MKHLLVALLTLISINLYATDRIGLIGIGAAEILTDLDLISNVITVDENIKLLDSYKDKTTFVQADLEQLLEQIVKLKLSHIVCKDIEFTKEEFAKLKDSEVKIIKLNSKNSIENIIKNINHIARVFGKMNKAKELENEIKIKQSGIEFASYMGNSGVKTLYLNIINKDSINCSGKATPAFTMINFALGKNVCQEKGWVKLENQNYKPELIICNKDGFDRIGGEKALAQILSKNGMNINKTELYVVNGNSFLAFGSKMPNEVEKLISFYGKMK